MERTPWRWTIERRGNFGERDLYIGRPPGPGPVVELLLPAGLTPAILVGDDLAAERARICAEAAAVCREAGCCCFGLHEIDPDAFDGKIETWDTGSEDGFESEIVRHDSRCPDALAARIEALAFGKED